MLFECPPFDAPHLEFSESLRVLTEGYSHEDFASLGMLPHAGQRSSAP
jgi:hypothetical protein